MDTHDLRRRLPWNETVKPGHQYREMFRDELVAVTDVGPVVQFEYLDTPGATGKVRREWFEKAMWCGVIRHPSRCPECPTG